MPDESRVKPQPLQPEAKPFPEWELAAVLSNLEGFVKSFGGRAVASRILATIEEARREQPEPQGVLCTDCNRIIIASAEIKIRGGRAVHFNCPGAVFHGELEQPVRVTDADEAGRGFAKDYSEANFSTPEEREAHRLTAIDGFDQGVQYCRSRDDYPALAAAPNPVRVTDKELCDGCGQRHRYVDGTPHPLGRGFVCADPHAEEIPHRCGYWASRCNNGKHGLKAAALLAAAPKEGTDG